LEDINEGCTKKMKITRKRFQPGGFVKNEEKFLEIEIKKGWKVSMFMLYIRSTVHVSHSKYKFMKIGACSKKVDFLLLWLLYTYGYILKENLS